MLNHGKTVRAKQREELMRTALAQRARNKLSTKTREKDAKARSIALVNECEAEAVARQVETERDMKNTQRPFTIVVRFVLIYKEDVWH